MSDAPAGTQSGEAPRRRVRSGATAAKKDRLEISPAAAAMLEMTSDNTESPGRDVLPFISSMDSYLIGGVATAIAEECRREGWNQPTDAQIKSCIYSYLSQIEMALQEHYRKLPVLFVGYAHDSAAIEQNILSVMMLSYVTQTLAPSPAGLDDQSVVDMVNESIRSGYKQLMQKELILDPILETSIGLAILSLAPFSITKKTRKGEQTYLRLRSLMWSYERKKTRDGGTDVDLRFEAARIARALKTGIVAAFHDATKGEGLEP